MLQMLPLGAFQKLHCLLYPPRDADFYRSRNNLSKRALIDSEMNTMLVVFDYDPCVDAGSLLFCPLVLKVGRC
jgi:hypothetical protein